MQCLAEEIVQDVFSQVCQGDPHQQSKWANCVELTQKRIDRSMEAMTRLAAKDARRPSPAGDSGLLVWIAIGLLLVTEVALCDSLVRINNKLDSLPPKEQSQ
jgi:hypothetical protein